MGRLPELQHMCIDESGLEALVQGLRELRAARAAGHAPAPAPAEPALVLDLASVVEEGALQEAGPEGAGAAEGEGGGVEAGGRGSAEQVRDARRARIFGGGAAPSEGVAGTCEGAEEAGGEGLHTEEAADSRKGAEAEAAREAREASEPAGGDKAAARHVAFFLHRSPSPAPPLLKAPAPTHTGLVVGEAREREIPGGRGGGEGGEKESTFGCKSAPQAIEFCNAQNSSLIKFEFVRTPEEQTGILGEPRW